MRYLLTEHGSVLKYDEESKELMILNMDNEWNELVGYSVTLPVRTQVAKKRNNILNQSIALPPATADLPPPVPNFHEDLPPPPPPPRDDKPSQFAPPPPPIAVVQTTGVTALDDDELPPPPLPPFDESQVPPLPQASRIPANLPPPPPLQNAGVHAEEMQFEYTVGSIKINDKTNVIISDIDQISILDKWKGSDLDNPHELATLGADQERRVKAGLALRESTRMPVQTPMTDEEIFAITSKRAGTSTYNSVKLMKFVAAEKNRLKKPFTINGKAKLRLIEAAEQKIVNSQLLWNDSDESHFVREKNGYIQQARESGLIDALNWHRIRSFRKSKRDRPTTSINRLEAEDPGISKKI